MIFKDFIISSLLCWLSIHKDLVRFVYLVQFFDLYIEGQFNNGTQFTDLYKGEFINTRLSKIDYGVL